MNDAKLVEVERAPGSAFGWIVDEAHHVLRDNMWGKALEIFSHPDCRGLMPTATPGRGSGIAIGVVEGPPVRALIAKHGDAV